MKLKITLLLVCSFALMIPSWAQDGSQYGLPKAKDFNTWSVGARAGLNIFQGDIGPEDDDFLNGTDDFTYGLQVTKRISHTLGIRGRGMLGTFSGTEKGEPLNTTDAMGNPIRVATNTDFEADMWEGTLNLVYNFGNISFLNRSKRFHLEIEAGIGYFNYDSKRTYVSTDMAQTYSGEITKNDGEVMLPVGAGAKYQLGRADIGVYYNFRKTFTDAVDVLDNGLTENDNYSQVTVGINVTLGKKQDHLEWVNPMQIVYDDIVDMKDKMDLLSNDKDKDGVADIFDKDNSTPEGAKVYGDGTAIDTDSDGIPDAQDGDPYTPKGATVDENGVEVDTDGDGVPDSRDTESSTPAGTLVNYQGVTIPQVDLEQIKQMMGSGALALPSVFFSSNSSAVQAQYGDRILMISKLLKNYPSINIIVEGHADVTGADTYNEKLAQRRADNVMNKLIKEYGVDASRLSATAKGEREPASNASNRMNRRVDFVIVK